MKRPCEQQGMENTNKSPYADMDDLAHHACRVVYILCHCLCPPCDRKKKTSPQFYRNETEKQSHASRSNVQSLSSFGVLVRDETVKIGAIQQVFHIFQETMILTILAGFLESNTTVTLTNIVFS